MIDKDQAQQAGFRTVSADDRPAEERKAKIDALQRLLPDAVNGDNIVNVEALQELLGAQNTAANNRGYELSFAGKGLAKAEADRPTEYELKTEQAQSKDFDNTENVIIRGDNIDALKILRQNYTGKVKMIYIDPPYNTENDGFVYKDNFRQSEAELIETLGMGEDSIDYLHNVYSTKSHSGWLSFIYPRLKLARDLLRDDGVIFISIDDNEQAPLKIICDEIFGEENFVANIIIQTNPRGRQLDKYLAKTCEYIFTYIKNSDSKGLFEVPKSGETMQEYNKQDEKGKYRLLELRNRGSAQFNKETRPNLYFPIYVNPKTGNVSLEKNSDFCEKALPINSKEEDGCWTWGKKKVTENLNALVGRQVSSGMWRIFRKDYVPELGAFSKEKALWLDTTINHEVGRERVTSFFGFSVFDFPKSHGLLLKLLKIGCKSNDIILDFFAGSGTTADAVMQMNAEDNGNRKFILVQWDEDIDSNNNKVAHDFCIDNHLAPVISSICIERVHRAGDKIKTEQAHKTQEMFTGEPRDLDIGYKVFSLAPRPQLAADENNQLTLNVTRQSAQDTLYNMIAASGQILTQAIETIEQNLLYKAAEAYYLLGKCEYDIAQITDNAIYIDGYADIALENWLNMDALNKENITILY